MKFLPFLFQIYVEKNLCGENLCGEKKINMGPNFLGTLLPILRLTFLESSCNFRKFGFKKMMGIFFDLTGLQDPCVV